MSDELAGNGAHLMQRPWTSKGSLEGRYIMYIFVYIFVCMYIYQIFLICDLHHPPYDRPLISPPLIPNPSTIIDP
jgi:hypothetical protein